MDDSTAQALGTDRVIDITTVGRRSGEPRRIEIWFHRVDGRFYITGTPGRPRAWYANLVDEPAFTFHLKESATADLAAHARPVTDPAERRAVLTGILAGIPELAHGDGRTSEDWFADSPLVEVTFDA
ncbi:nitroreductase/quinone reductase family protein [Cellulomonas sp. HZM]|uniref:nitroreductase/quinone reductase family protein n=1 Tax=Cellulomonas sp. HZM TaxID=1454010 RepID=UPI0004934BBB|nr:nitroreductase/quinone reductase family protein [Cellulomonas sp. HZM]